MNRSLLAVRTVADSIASITESVLAQVFEEIIRFASDSVASITESANRSASLVRSAADSLPSLAEAVSRIGTFARGAVDSIPTLSELVTFGKHLGHRISATLVAHTHSLAMTIASIASALTVSRTLSTSITINGEAVTTILVEGDTAPTILATINDDVTGSPVNLTGCTVYFQLRRVADRRFLVNAAADIVTPAAGTVAYNLANDDLDFDAECQAQFLVIFTDLRRQTTAVPIPVTVRSR
jgi:hypothetical protein